MLHPTAVCVALAVLVPEVPAPPGMVQAAVEKALPRLAQGATGHIEQKTCFACHNQAFPMAAFAAARSRGFTVADDLLPKQQEHIRDFIERNREAYTSGKGTGGQVDTAGWLLFTLERAGETPSELTAAVVEYLLKRDADRGPWRATSNRPPSEASQFTANFLALRGLMTWATFWDRERVEQRIKKTRQWLEEAPAKDTEDHVYRLRALVEVEAKPATIRAAVQQLLAMQRADGGWAQTNDRASDPYATATVLVALHETGQLAPTAAAYRKGVAFLVRTQRPDGTWYVRSRSRPFQPYYESGFPHGKDQFIAITASAWATTALALACGDEKR